MSRGLEIEIAGRSRAGLDEDALRVVARVVLEAEGVARGEVGLRFVGEATMRTLNRDYRRVEAVTDVLSFPLEDDHEAQGGTPGRFVASWDDAGVPRLLGDVVICSRQARRQARRADVPFAFEISLLLVHGLLHLLGYDHETDAGQMALRQAELLEVAPWEAVVAPR